MSEPIDPTASPELARKRRELAPEILDAFEALSARAFADDARPAKTKPLIGVDEYDATAIDLDGGCSIRFRIQSA